MAGRVVVLRWGGRGEREKEIECPSHMYVLALPHLYYTTDPSVVLGPWNRPEYEILYATAAMQGMLSVLN